MAEQNKAGYKIERLNNSHNRQNFYCGVKALDDYFHRQAGQDDRKNAASPYVLIDEETGEIAGYYTLCATSIDFKSLPSEIAKKLPKYPFLPAYLIGRLATDKRFRSKGYGKKLLMSALFRSLQNSKEIASVFVVVDAKNEEIVKFYKNFNFNLFNDISNRLYLLISEIEILFSPFANEFKV